MNTRLGECPDARLSFQVANGTALSFQGKTFDYVFDKGTYDSIVSGPQSQKVATKRSNRFKKSPRRNAVFDRTMAGYQQITIAERGESHKKSFLFTLANPQTIPPSRFALNPAEKHQATSVIPVAVHAFRTWVLPIIAADTVSCGFGEFQSLRDHISAACLFLEESDNRPF
jgi:hypothetical protein